jgi:Protein of unknown function (DUF1475)
MTRVRGRCCPPGWGAADSGPSVRPARAVGENMKRVLMLFFAAVLVSMLVVTTIASLERGVFAALAGLWPDGWFRATLADAYFGFVTFWLWIAYRESRWPARLGWLAAVLLLGNFAMALYAFGALRKLPDGAPVWHALLRPEHRPRAGAGGPASLAQPGRR